MHQVQHYAVSNQMLSPGFTRQQRVAAFASTMMCKIEKALCMSEPNNCTMNVIESHHQRSLQSPHHPLDQETRLEHQNALGLPRDAAQQAAGPSAQAEGRCHSILQLGRALVRSRLDGSLEVLQGLQPKAAVKKAVKVHFGSLVHEHSHQNRPPFQLLKAWPPLTQGAPVTAASLLRRPDNLE
jgi:hypothetical protein